MAVADDFFRYSAGAALRPAGHRPAAHARRPTGEFRRRFL